MIHEVDEGLRRLLSETGLTDGGVELVFDAPTKDWSARRNAPTISVFLYDIREDVSRRQSGQSQEHDETGVVTGWRTPPRWFDLMYLVTAWTNRPQDEHRLLSQALRCLTRSDVLPARLLTGTLAELGLGVRLDAAAPRGDGPSASDVWTALGGELKAAIDLRISAPLSGERTATGPPVTEGLVVKSATSHDGAPEGRTQEQASAERPADDASGSGGPGRRLRYQGVGDPGPDGFASPRARPLPPGRRRRGGTAR